MDYARREPIAYRGFMSHACYRLIPAPVMTGSPSSVSSMQPVGGFNRDSDLLCYGDKVITTSPNGPNNTGEFIGQGNGSNIMTPLLFDSKRPGTKSVGRGILFGMHENRASAVNKKHAQVSIPPLGDAPEAVMIAAGIFPGSETEEAGEVASRRESMDIADKSNQSSGGHKANTRDRTKLVERGVIPCQRLELPFNSLDTSFELSDFISHISERRSQQLGDRTFRIVDEIPHSGHDLASTDGDGDAEFPEDTTSRVNASGPVGDVFGTETVKGCEGMLIRRFNRHGSDVFVAKSFENTLGVGAVGFVTDDVGVDGVGWEKDGGMTELLKLTSPVMGGAAGLEDNSCRLSFCEEALEARPGESMLFVNTTGIIGDGDFKDGFSEIDGDSSARVHSGLLLHESDWY